MNGNVWQGGKDGRHGGILNVACNSKRHMLFSSHESHLLHILVAFFVSISCIACFSGHMGVVSLNI